ncbi:MAG: hydrogenase maturation protease [Candidatus Omnitrophica bacterium COP1]|nr:hydrogenase maturation protease [Candidatus Omnitrophica bacterium COP1]
MNRVLVIGFGNPLRGDDGFGWEVAGQLERRLSQESPVHILTPIQLAPELAETLTRYDHVFFVDAALGDQPGRLILTEIAEGNLDSGFTHHLDPQALLASARILFGAQPRGLILTVDGLNFELGQGLSDPITRALPEAVHLLEKEIEKILGDDPEAQAFAQTNMEVESDA